MKCPNSPQLKLEEQIDHFGHPQHHLYRIENSDLFTCSGCKEYGSGTRFVGRQCDFQLHEFCGLPPQQLEAHSLHMQHQLVFASKPGEILKSKCDVCGKSAKGYIFRCNACSYQIHPCCAMLSNEMNISVHPHLLKILPAITSSDGDLGFVCGECNKPNRSGRVFGCRVCDYHLHAVCAKNMVNGLRANGFKGVEKASKVRIAARFAFLLIIDFIRGLADGIGEGIGQDLVK